MRVEIKYLRVIMTPCTHAFECALRHNIVLLTCEITVRNNIHHATAMHRQYLPGP